MPRRASYAIIALILALGAPLGLGALRSWQAGALSLSWISAELARDPLTYVYVTFSTVVVLSAFGYVLGRQADRLYELSSTDALTGLDNRRHLQERLEEECARAERYGSMLSLLLIDLDGLKALNDRLGHRAGDVALRRAASAIRSGSRASDVSARWGGDEFVVLAPDTGLDEAAYLAERIRSFVAEEVTTGGPEITVSVGVATFDPARWSATPEALVRVADTALYEAKRAGRNRVVVAET
jgi:diguanylate cyclase (GGDEF)-like protein